MLRRHLIVALLGFACFFPRMATVGQEQTATSPASVPEPVTFTTQEDHRNMMEQLGITKLRPGPSGRADAPNLANYDESLANPFPNLPAALTLKNGEPVNTPQMWWNKRRA